MSEFIAVMGGSGDEYTVSEHTTTRVLTGEPEAVRARLVYGLESLGYAVTSDSPLLARRPRRKDILRADFTDHPRRLSVGLRQVGSAATQVTFDFAVSHGGFSTKGDLLTLEREADAVVALAQTPPATGPCLSCGTENGGDARFCRLCGAPTSTGAPAELEVLRLTASSRAGLQEFVCGALIAALAFAVGLALILLSVRPKPVNIGWGILVIGQIIGWWIMLYGMVRINRALKSKAGLSASPVAAPAQLAPPRETALPPAHISVTEGTTELLGSIPREKVPARRGHSDTGPMG